MKNITQIKNNGKKGTLVQFLMFVSIVSIVIVTGVIFTTASSSVFDLGNKYSMIKTSGPFYAICKDRKVLIEGKIIEYNFLNKILIGKLVCDDAFGTRKKYYQHFDDCVAGYFIINTSNGMTSFGMLKKECFDELEVKYNIGKPKMYGPNEINFDRIFDFNK